MPRTVTVTETVTRFGIDGPPTTTPLADPHTIAPGFGEAIHHVSVPAFFSTIMFLLTTIAIFLATAAVSFLILHTKPALVKLYNGTSPKLNPAEDKESALNAARSVTLCHVITVLALVLRTREALAMLSSMAYEVCALILSIEAAVVVVVGCVWGVAKVLELGDMAAKGTKAT